MPKGKIAQALQRPVKENLSRLIGYIRVYWRTIRYPVRRTYTAYASLGTLCHLFTRLLARIISPRTIYRALGIWPFSPISYSQFEVWGKLDPPVSAYLKGLPKSSFPSSIPWKPCDRMLPEECMGYVVEVRKGIALSNGISLDHKGNTIMGASHRYRSFRWPPEKKYIPTRQNKTTFQRQLERLGPLTIKPWSAKLELNAIRGGGVLVLSSSYDSAFYGHYIYEVIGRLSLVEDQIDAYPVIYVRNNMPYQKRYLSMLGLDKKQIISADLKMPSGITADRLVIPCFRRVEDYLIAPKITSYLRKNLLPYADRSLNQGERIYISRRKAKRRRIFNELELRPILAEYGFSVVHLEDYSVDKQISVFKFAKIIVSPHGTGLDNLLYCDPGTKVLEIFPGNNVESDIYFIVATSLKLKYSYLTAIGVSDKKSTRHDDMIVQPDLFRQQLELLC